jgi:hypothetical protein
MDIGVYWSPAVLEHKLERADAPGRLEEVWNCHALPNSLGRDREGDRLFIASGAIWVGWFRLVPEVLYNPEDSRCPFSLIFDAKTWTSLRVSIPCRRFRGWTYQVPNQVRRAASGT